MRWWPRPDAWGTCCRWTVHVNTVEVGHLVLCTFYCNKQKILKIQSASAECIYLFYTTNGCDLTEFSGMQFILSYRKPWNWLYTPEARAPFLGICPINEGSKGTQAEGQSEELLATDGLTDTHTHILHTCTCRHTYLYTYRHTSTHIHTHTHAHHPL